MGLNSARAWDHLHAQNMHFLEEAERVLGMKPRVRAGGGVLSKCL